MKILVIGDFIQDVYTFGTATRLCPEAPVPVIVPTSPDNESNGGAGLVHEQLLVLGSEAVARFGSYSRKHRYFAGNHLIARIDEDSIDDHWYSCWERSPLTPSLEWADAFVISDYGKGAMTRELARQIVDTDLPCFVDAKHHWHWYWNGRENVAIFPNEHEIDGTARFSRVVRKLGSNGCTFKSHNKDARGIPEEWWMPATVSEVVDTTGAGDIFMASFVYAWSLQHPAEDCLRFANEMAGESCRHRGTFVVGREFATGVLDRLRASQASAQQVHASSHDSTQSGPLPPHVYDPHYLTPCASISQTIDNLPEYFPGRVQVTLGVCHSPLDERTPLKSPSGPTESTDTPTPSDREILDEPSGKPPWEG